MSTLHKSDTPEIPSRLRFETLKKAQLEERLAELQRISTENYDKTADQLVKLREHTRSITELIHQVDSKMWSLKERHQNLAVRDQQISAELDEQLAKRLELSEGEDLDEKASKVTHQKESLERKMAALLEKNSEIEEREAALEKKSAFITIKEERIRENEATLQSLLEMVRLKEARIAEKEEEVSQKEAEMEAKFSEHLEVEVKTEELDHHSAEWRKHKEKFRKSLVEGYKKLKDREEYLGKWDY